MAGLVLSAFQVVLLGVPLPDVSLCAEAPPAIPLFLNSHATAAAYAARSLGVARPDEADRTLVAVASVYVQGCPSCGDAPPKWDVMGGLQSLLADRGRAVGAVERYRVGASGGEAISLEEVARAVAAGSPVLATFCYEPGARRPGVARQREGGCFTVAVIGVVAEGGQGYLIARDGLAEGQGCEAAADRVAPGEAGLDPGAGVWSDPGTGLYRWEGANTNVVVVLAEQPEPDGGVVEHAPAETSGGGGAN